jgi:hypothetical protein
VSPDPWLNSFLVAVAVFTAAFFALAAWIPVGLMLRWLLVV